MPRGAGAAGRSAAPRLSIDMAPVVEKQTRKARRQRQNSLNGTGLEDDELAELVFASKQHDAFEDVRHLPHKTSTRSPNLFRPTWGRYMPPPNLTPARLAATRRTATRRLHPRSTIRRHTTRSSRCENP